jgi:hypothetical protein
MDHAQHPVGRVGKPEDIASLVAYLISGEAGFITGQNFVVDGGMTQNMIYEECATGLLLLTRNPPLDGQTLTEILMLTVYLASPLGFSPEWKTYKDKIKRRLNELGHTVFDPWDQPFRPTIEKASTIEDWCARVAAFKEIATRIGRANEEPMDFRYCLWGLDGAG